MKIMIVDDEKRMLSVLRSILLNSSIKVKEIIECVSGEEAIKNYFIHKPDCVLMDVELEKMSGLEATKIISAQDTQANVVIVTSYDSDSLRNKAREMGAKDYVIKDNLSEIIESIRVVTNYKRFT